MTPLLLRPLDRSYRRACVYFSSLYLPSSHPTFPSKLVKENDFRAAPSARSAPGEREPYDYGVITEFVGISPLTTGGAIFGCTITRANWSGRRATLFLVRATHRRARRKPRDFGPSLVPPPLSISPPPTLLSRSTLPEFLLFPGTSMNYPALVSRRERREKKVGERTGGEKRENRKGSPGTKGERASGERARGTGRSHFQQSNLRVVSKIAAARAD
jgi:hypothetical protein